jgi:hypothetical protein
MYQCCNLLRVSHRAVRLCDTALFFLKGFPFRFVYEELVSVRRNKKTGFIFQVAQELRR